EFDDTMIEKRRSRLQAGCHACAIKLDQDVAWQVTGHIAIEDAGRRIGKRWNPTAGGHTLRDRHRVWTEHRQSLVELALVRRVEYASKSLQVVAAQYSLQA